MNQPIQQLVPINLQDDGDDESKLATYLDFLLDHRGLIAGIALAITLLGVAYAFIAKPIYEANILIQVEDSPNSSKSIMGDLSSMFDTKTAASSEIELLRSRMLVSNAVDSLRLTINARPKYFPIIGQWMAARDKQLSDPGIAGYGGYVWGAEKIDVLRFNVSGLLLNLDFTLTAESNGRFRLSQSSQHIQLQGRVGATLTATTEYGTLELLVESLAAKPGAQFLVKGMSRLATIENLQNALAISEKGKQSGIIGVTLEGSDPILTSRILNEIGRKYVRQNVERNSAEAEKSLIFLDKQLPELKRQLEHSEEKYNRFRKIHGTIDLGEEAKALLLQSVNAQTKLIELQQKREELLIHFESDHPAVDGIDHQMTALNQVSKNIAAQIKTLPGLEQDVLRLARDVKVNTDLYTGLLSNAQQLRLVKASKVGSVRLVDAAMIPEQPIRPRRALVIASAMLIGLLVGVLSAFVKKTLYGRIDDPYEIEKTLGLAVYATIPHSKKQEGLYRLIHAKSQEVSVLAQSDPTDRAIESLRSLRTAFHFSMLGSKNNIVMIAGPTPCLGKTFVSVNFGVVLTVTDKRVLLVDADLRKGYLHQYFGVDRQGGLSDVIAGVMRPEQVIHRDVIANVDFISTGNLPLNPSEMLLHANFAELLTSLAFDYDYVLIDTPPVLSVSDAIIMSSQAGAILLVTRAGASTIGEIKESIKRLNRAGIAINGVVVNDLKLRPGRYGYGKYRHAHYHY